MACWAQGLSSDFRSVESRWQNGVPSGRISQRCDSSLNLDLKDEQFVRLWNLRESAILSQTF